ncbi:MAG: diguanylate cyclase [Burkholderiaceae bacterium]
MTGSTPAPVPSSPPARRPVLLVVDDQSTTIQTLYQVFAKDHQVLMARSAQAALQVCAAQLPDLILLDVMMPDMDGYALCTQLKTDARLRDIPIIFVTTHDDEVAETRGLDAGAVDFISKPINPRIVRARVRTHLTLKAQSDQLRRQAYVDGLTGLSNRRHFDETLEREWNRARRQGAALSVVLLDVDFFKRFNDRYGHLGGDDCLRRVAGVLADSIKRPADVSARYGGEEFACILPDADLAGALQFADQLRLRVRALDIAHAHSDVAPVVTISLGVGHAVADAHHDTQSLLQLADAQLYAAKSDGRDRVCGAQLVAG